MPLYTSVLVRLCSSLRSDCPRDGILRMLDVPQNDEQSSRSHTIKPLVVPERSIFLGYYRNALFKFTSESGLSSISSADTCRDPWLLS